LGGRRKPNGHSALTVSDLFAQVRPVLERSAEHGNMELVMDAGDAAAVRINADPRTLERILLNLTDNACKYASEAADRRIHVQARAVRGRRPGVAILVRDHGPGIPRRERRRVFEAFHRAHRDADGPKSGLGLGLALARGLARGSGGDLVLVRTEGPGAQF